MAQTDSGPPVNTSPPTVSGIARQGETLTASAGSWSGSAPISYAYQWSRCEPGGYRDAVLAAGPIGYWRLGELSGTSASDVSSLAHHGSYGGSFLLDREGALALDADRAAELRAGSSPGRVSVSHRSTLNYGNSVTYEAWLRLLSLPSSSSSGLSLASKSSDTLLVRVLPSGQVSLRRAGSDEIARSTAALAVDGAYHHLVAIKAGSDVRIYLDGVNVTGAVSNRTLSSNSSSFTLGNGVDAQLDEFALYARGLSAAEVAAHYAAGHPCEEVTGATDGEYELTGDDVGRLLQVAVTGSNVAGASTALSQPSETVSASAPSPPSNVALPEISGTPALGETLTASAGSWTGDEPMSYAYRWRRCDPGGDGCTDVVAAAESDYALSADDVGTTVRVVVTASNAGGSDSATSAATAPVSGGGSPPTAPTNTAPPQISGTPAVGQTLTASPGSWSGSEPISYAYQWRRCLPSYQSLVLSAAPLGYWRLGELSGTSASDVSGLGHHGSYGGNHTLGRPGALALDSDKALGLSRSEPAGLVSVAHRTTMNYADAVTYEAWLDLNALPSASSIGANIATKGTGTLVLRILPSGILSMRKSSGSEIAQSTVPLSTSAGYQHVVAVKAGATVRLYLDGVEVTGSVTAQTLTNSTEPLTVVSSLPSGNREGIEGDLDELAVYGAALSAAQVQAHFQAGREGVCSEIAGATSASYLVVAGDAGGTLQVQVTASNAAGQASALSQKTAPVAGGGSPPTAPTNSAPPQISGTPAVGQTLTASPGSWSGSEPISYAYQWRRCDGSGGACGDVAGATATTHALTSADLGSTMRVAVTASNAAGSGTAVSAATSQVQSGQSGPIGYEGPSFIGAGDSGPTGSKPESKLWWNDGFWWATMWATGTPGFHIYRLDLGTQTWVNTGTKIDGRPGSRADALWDGTRLYVASHVFSTCGCSAPQGGQPSRLFRYSYDAGTNEYTLDTGFPVEINDTRSETLVIDKDSTGTLWATWAQSNRVYVNRTLGDDQTWGTPFFLPLAEAQDLNTDDISSLVAFDGNKIGVMWSNQTRSAMYFAVHVDGDPDDAWQGPEVAVDGQRSADDHINLHATSTGRVIVAMKTSRDEGTNPNPADPQIMVLARSSSASWSAHTAGTVADDHTRPILLLDEDGDTIHVFATAPTAGGTIYHKTSSLSQISFATGRGTPFIHAGGSAVFNNTTSTKQNVNATTGIVVAASEGSTNRYWHNYLALGS